jgi:bacterioferritin
VPNVQRLWKVNVGETVPEQLKLDLELEMDAVKRLNEAIALASEVGDNGTREILEDMLEDEEEHVDWLEAQLHQLDQLGEKLYLSQQIREEEEE